MLFDDVVIQLGQFGKYQRIQYFLLCIPGILCAYHQLASVFLAAVPEFSSHTFNNQNSMFTLFSHRCQLPDGVYNETDTYQIQNSYHESLINKWVPIDSENANNRSYKTCKLNNSTACDGYVYSQELLINSITTDFDLVCENEIKTTISTSVYMAGVLAGAFFFGILSDWIGRKKTMLIALLLQGVTGLASGLVPKNYYVFIVLRFFTGAGSMGLFMTNFVLGMELIGPKYRLVAGIVIQYFFALGYVLVTGFAYATKQWQYLEIAMSAPSFLFLTYYWFVPESARWLLAKGRTAEANEIVQKAAKVNNVTLPENVFDNLKSESHKEKISAILRSPRLVTRSLVIFFNWAVIAMSYYGLSLNSGSLGGNLYINFMLGGLVEFPAYTACFLCNLLGRKPLHLTGMMIGGLACLGTVFFDLYARKVLTEAQLGVAFISLNMIGKFGMTIAFCIIYLWSAELFPTSIRNTLMGFSSTLARIGSIAAPFIGDLGKYVEKKYEKVLPAAIFGSLVLIGGFGSIILPETAGHSLPETIEESENFPHHARTKYGDKLSDPDYDQKKEIDTEM
ncbi:organic cation transporter protein-like [Watersipora subatra]|uniref:organic cation transporter protein-like n=1 Tax=Watersipora subatra TaxID=2589382 RepID=UPI00355C1630